MFEGDSRGASGRVSIGNVDALVTGEAPVCIEIEEDDSHRNLLALDAEILLSVTEGVVTLNLSMEDVEEVSHEDWQEQNHPAVENE